VVASATTECHLGVDGRRARILTVHHKVRTPYCSNFEPAVVQVANRHARGFASRDSDVVITRPGPLANPFPMEDGDSRDDVCGAFRVLLEGGASARAIACDRGLNAVPRPIKGGTPAFWRALGELEQRVARDEHFRLVCGCAPRRCHGHELLEFLGVDGAEESSISLGAMASLRFYASLLTARLGGRE